MRDEARAQLSVRLSVCLVTVCSIFLLVGGAADAEPPPPVTEPYVVAAGDTLWAIASERTEPGEDTRVTVGQIKEASGLESSSIRPGQILRVPAR